MQRLLILITALIFSVVQPAFAHNGSDDASADDHSGRNPVSTRPAEHTARPSDDNSPDSGRPGHDSRPSSEGWTKLRPISASGISAVRVRVRSEDKRRESRLRAQITVKVPNTSLGFVTSDDALAATYLLRIERSGQSTINCTLSADRVLETFPMQADFALDVRSKSAIVVNKKGGCVTAGDATLTAVLPSLSAGSVVTASIVIAGQSRDVAVVTVR